MLLNHNKLLGSYEGCIGVKTGFTKKTGRCLVSAAERDGVTLIAVTLNAPDDWRDHTAMLDYGFSGFAVVTPRMEEPAAVPVKLGREDSVFLVAGEEQPILMEKSQRNLVTTQIELEPEATAPVSKGQKLGTMTIRAGDQVLAQVPLVAEKSVEKLSWGQMFLQVLRSICLG